MSLKERVFVYIVCDILCELERISKETYCSFDNKAKAFRWLENARSFHYLLWYLTELARANNLRLCRGTSQLNIKAFNMVFADPPQIDKTEKQKVFRIGIYSGEPKKIIEKAVQKVLKEYVVDFKAV